MAKRETYAQKKERIKNLPESEFEILCRAAWRKYENTITNGEDSIPYWEYYSEMADEYDRKSF